MNVNPNDIRISDRLRDLSATKVEELTDSIREIGLINPITVTPDLTLIAGAHRLAACKALGMESVPVNVKNLDPVRQRLIEIDENLIRNNGSALENAELTSERKRCWEELYPDTKHGAVGNGRSRDPESGSLPASFIEDTAAKTGRSRSVVAEDAKIGSQILPEIRDALRGTDTADHKTDLLDIARIPEAEQRELIAKGEKEILARAKEIRAKRGEERRQGRIEKLVEISRGNAELKTPQRYPLIYCDPPWRYEHAISDDRKIENQYPTMDLEDICALPVGDITTDDCVMFMWVTAPKIEESIKVLQRWGFSYRTCAVWDKQKIGMGYYFRQQTELLFVATKGSPPAPAVGDRSSSLVSIPRGKHSAKPVEFYELIERMYPELPKIEMFCREAREGWAAWGNQAARAA